MDIFKQTFKKIGQNLQSNELNLRKVDRRFPQVERKNDQIIFNSPYRMEFNTSDHPHIVKLNLYVKPPPSCFKCKVGISTFFTEAVAPNASWGPDDGNAHPVVYTSFSSNEGGFGLDPSGGIIVPVSGVYNVEFALSTAGVIVSPSAAIVSSVRLNGVIVAQKVYSVTDGTLESGFLSVNHYGLCMEALAGDIVGGWVAAGGIAFFGISGSTRATLIALN